MTNIIWFILWAVKNKYFLMKWRNDKNWEIKQIAKVRGRRFEKRLSFLKYQKLINWESIVIRAAERALCSRWGRRKAVAHFATFCFAVEESWKIIETGIISWWDVWRSNRIDRVNCTVEMWYGETVRGNQCQATRRSREADPLRILCSFL